MKEIKKYEKKYLSSFLLGMYPVFSNIFAGTQAAVNQVNKLVNSLYKLIQAAGFLITIYAVGMFILDMRSENSDAIGKRIMQICVGLFLYGLKGLIS